MTSNFYSRYALAILACAAFGLPFMAIGAGRAMRTNTNDVRTWLPADYAETSQYRWFKEQFGTEEFVLVTWEGCVLERDDQGRDVNVRSWPGEDEQITTLERFARRVLPPAGDPQADVRRESFLAVMTGPRILDQLGSEPANLSPEDALPRLQGKLFGPDGKQTCAIITPTEGGKARLHAMLDAVRKIAVEECGISLHALRMGGPPVINAAVDDEGARSLSQLALFSGVVGLLVAWFCFRSLRLTLFVFLTGVYAAFTGLAVVWYAGGTMNAVLMTMPPLVYVATMSGAIHLVNYYREALGEVGPHRAPLSAVLHARVPLTLATLTTSIGLLSLCYSELLPIKQFGVYSAIGVASSALFLFLFLPAALQAFPLREPAAAIAADVPHGDDGLLRLSRPWRLFAQFVTARSAVITVGCLALMAVMCYGMQWMKTSIKVERFFRPDSHILRQYAWIEEHLGALVPMELVIRMDKETCKLTPLERMELVDRVQRSVESLHDVGSTTSTVTFARDLPGGAGWSVSRSAYNRQMQRHRSEFLRAGFLRETPDEELWRISLRVGANNDVDYGAFVAEIQNQVEPVLAAAESRGEQGISAVYTGMVPVVYKAQRSLLDGLISGFTTDLLLIVIAVVVLMRHWSPGFLIMLTSMFPSAIVFGGMSWLGVVVDIGTVMTPCVALGVTVDDVVHFLLWFRRGIERGLDRRRSVMLAFEGCAKPMYQSWGVLGLGLSVFAFSPFTPTMRFGALMVALLTAGLFGNLIFLPALLCGPLGAIFERRIKRAQSRQEAAERTSSPVVPIPGQPAPAETYVRPQRRSVKT